MDQTIRVPLDPKALARLREGAGLSDAQLYRWRQAMLEATACPDAEPSMAVSGDGVPIHLATPITNPALLRVCTKRIGMTGTMSLAVTPVAVGTVLAATSPLARRFPTHFRLATADDVGGT